MTLQRRAASGIVFLLSTNVTSVVTDTINVYIFLFPQIQKSVLDTLEHISVLNDLEILRLVLEQLVRIVLASEGIGSHLRLRHLLRDLCSSCDISVSNLPNQASADNVSTYHCCPE